MSLVSVFVQFTLDKIPSKIFMFTTHFFVTPCIKATNSGGPDARQSTTDSAHL